MANREPIAPGEWYHCYGRGVDKRKTFLNTKDYERFMLGMYLSNGSKPVRISNFKKWTYQEMISNVDCGKQIVEMGAFCIMPNHFHFVIREIEEGGIAAYMQRLMTGYTMYFNIKNDRTGALFSGTFKSKHIPDDAYFKQVISYIHMNPVELFEPRWKDGVGEIEKIEAYLTGYRYSSLRALHNIQCLESKLLGKSIYEELYEDPPVISEMLEEAKIYYNEHSPI